MVDRLKNVAWVFVGAIVLYWGITTLVGTVWSGPLDPPAAPAETQKTQITSLPFTINSPGSYIVMADLTCTACAANKDGIIINSDDVTIDLNGFTIRGVVGSRVGILVPPTEHRSNVTISNGVVREWGQTGVNTGFADNGQLRDLLVSKNGAGLRGGRGVTISNITAYDNDGDGIVAGGASVVSNVTAFLNRGDGIIAGENSVISESVAAANTGDGIHVTNECLVIGNETNLSGFGGDGAGIHATGFDNRIEGNNVTGGERGIDVDVAGNIIIKNSASGNTTDYDIAAGNAVGAIIDMTAGGTIAADPWANFRY